MMWAQLTFGLVKLLFMNIYLCSILIYIYAIYAH